MKLKPFQEDPEEELTVNVPTVVNEVTQLAIREALGSVGITTTKAKKDISDTRNAFDRHGASLEDVAKSVGSLLRGAENEITRLKASEMALKVHGIFNEIEEKPEMSIVININGTLNNNLLTLICPKPSPV